MPTARRHWPVSQDSAAVTRSTRNAAAQAWCTDNQAPTLHAVPSAGTDDGSGVGKASQGGAGHNQAGRIRPHRVAGRRSALSSAKPSTARHKAANTWKRGDRG